MSSEESKLKPVISEIPVIKPQVWERLRDELDTKGERYYWTLGASIVKENPQQTAAYQEALLSEPNTSPYATTAAVILVLQALAKQAESEGSRLPELPDQINPLPALREFIPQAKGRTSRLFDLAYESLIATNPVIGEIISYISVGAPDELNRIATAVQAKQGAV